jgi:hypothetical protein
VITFYFRNTRKVKEYLRKFPDNDLSDENYPALYIEMRYIFEDIKIAKIEQVIKKNEENFLDPIFI